MGRDRQPVYRDTVYRDTVYRDTVYRDTVYRAMWAPPPVGAQRHGGRTGGGEVAVIVKFVARGLSS